VLTLKDHESKNINNCFQCGEALLVFPTSIPMGSVSLNFSSEKPGSSVPISGETAYRRVRRDLRLIKFVSDIGCTGSFKSRVMLNVGEGYFRRQVVEFDSAEVFGRLMEKDVRLLKKRSGLMRGKMEFK